MDLEIIKQLYPYIGCKDILSGLKCLGLNKGDNAFVHSSLSRFGYVEGGASTVIEALRETIIDSGTIIMPSFNMSIFSSNEIVYDVRKTPSEMGLITEIFRKMKGVKRNQNILHPLCFQGPLSNDILKMPD